MCSVWHQLSDGVLDHFEPVADDALLVVLHQILAALTCLQLHTNTTVVFIKQVRREADVTEVKSTSRTFFLDDLSLQAQLTEAPLSSTVYSGTICDALL